MAGFMFLLLIKILFEEVTLYQLSLKVLLFNIFKKLFKPIQK